MFTALLARSILLQMTKAFYVSLQQIITDIEHSVERITQVVAQSILLNSTEKKTRIELGKKNNERYTRFHRNVQFQQNLCKRSE